MKRSWVAIKAAAIASLVMVVLVAQALPLHPSAWPEYQQHCPSTDDRVVMVEALEGQFAGYTSVVCRREGTQRSERYFFDASFARVNAAELGADAYPALSQGLQQLLTDPASNINVNPGATVDVYLTIRTTEPPFPPLPYSYALSGSSYTDGTQTINTASYFVENEQVSLAEYEAYVAEARAAEQARRVEIHQSIEEQARLGFLTLVDVSGLSTSLNVAEINSDMSQRGYWWTRDTLNLSLTGAEIRQLNGSGSELFYMEEAFEATDGVFENDVQPLPATMNELASDGVLMVFDDPAADITQSTEAPSSDSSDGQTPNPSESSNPFSSDNDGQDDGFSMTETGIADVSVNEPVDAVSSDTPAADNFAGAEDSNVSALTGTAGGSGAFSPLWLAFLLCWPLCRKPRRVAYQP